ncbi:MAG: hypothetical protein WC936_01370 [Candidatus Nanoarchaeia archaeon]|jgi:hypothetical protein
MADFTDSGYYKITQVLVDPNDPNSALTPDVGEAYKTFFIRNVAGDILEKADTSKIILKLPVINKELSVRFEEIKKYLSKMDLTEAVKYYLKNDLVTTMKDDKSDFNDFDNDILKKFNEFLKSFKDYADLVYAYLEGYNPELIDALTDENKIRGNTPVTKRKIIHKIVGDSDLKNFLKELKGLDKLALVAEKMLKADQIIAIILHEIEYNADLIICKDDIKFLSNYSFAGISYGDFIKLNIQSKNKAEILADEKLAKYFITVIKRLISIATNTIDNFKTSSPFMDVSTFNEKLKLYLAKFMTLNEIEKELENINKSLDSFSKFFEDKIKKIDVKNAAEKFKGKNLTNPQINQAVTDSTMKNITEINTKLTTTKLTIFKVNDQNFFKAFNLVLSKIKEVYSELDLLDASKGLNLDNIAFYNDTNMNILGNINNINSLIVFCKIFHSFDMLMYNIMNDLKLPFSKVPLIENKVEFTQPLDNWDEKDHKFKVDNKEIGFSDFEKLSFLSLKDRIKDKFNYNLFSEQFKGNENKNNILYLQSVLLRINEWGA